MASEDSTERTSESSPVEPGSGTVELREAIGCSITGRFATAAVLVNRRLEVLRMQGAVRDYLDIPGDGPPAQGPPAKLTSLCREGLRSKLREAIRRSRREETPCTVTATRMRRNGARISVRVRVEPLLPGREADRQWLVCFEDVGSRASEVAGGAGSAGELPRVHGPLGSVSTPWAESARGWERVDADFTRFLESAQISMIVLDPQLRIRRLTTATCELLPVFPSDIGRSIDELATRWNDRELSEDARSALDSDRVVQREVEVPRSLNCTEEDTEPVGAQRTWLIRRMQPYHIPGDKIQGVVITFTDVSALKESAVRVERRERQTAVIAELGRIALKGGSLDTLFERVVQDVAQTLGNEMCKVLQLLPDGENLLLTAGVGWHDGLVGQATVDTGSHSQAGYTLQSRGPVIVDDLRSETRFSGPNLLIEHGVVSGMSVPIGPEHRPWGVLGTHTARRAVFTADDVNFLQAVSNLLWEAIERRRSEQQLRDRERRLTLVTDAMPVLIAYCDRDQVFQFCNRQYEDWFGLNQEQVVGRSLVEVIGSRAYEMVRSSVEQVLAGESVTYEQVLPYHHSPDREVRIRYIPDKTPAGEVVGYYAMIEDISDRAQDERLRNQLAAIVENSNDAIIGKNLDGIVTSWNSAAERMYGYSAEEMIGTPLQRILPDEGTAEFDWHLEQIRQGVAVEHFDTVRIHKNGSPLLVSVALSPIYDAFGNVIGASGINHDITLRKRAEAELSELTKLLEERVKGRTGLLKLMHDVTVACHHAAGPEEAVAYVLREFRRYSGSSYAHAFRLTVDAPQTLVPYSVSYDQEQRRFAKVRSAVSQIRMKLGEGLAGAVLASRKPEILPDIAQCPARLPYLRKLVGAGIRSGVAFPVTIGDQVVAVLEFFSDADQHVDERIEEAMTGIGSQLGRVVERTRLQREIAELTSDERRRIGSELHDTVIQQLTGSSMMAESLRQKLVNTPFGSAATSLVQTLKDMQGDVRRLYRGLMPVEVDAAGLMAALDDLAFQTAELHKIRCVFQCNENVLVQDSMTATNLYRIAREAVHNAVKHGDPRCITIELVSNPALRLTVADDGQGIDENVSRASGSGLRIMRYRAEVVGGRLTVESGVGTGTVISCVVDN